MHGGFISEPVEGDGAVYMQFLVSGDCFDTHPMFFLLKIVSIGRKMKIVNIIYWLQTTYTNPTHLEKKLHGRAWNSLCYNTYCFYNIIIYNHHRRRPKLYLSCVLQRKKPRIWRVSNSTKGKLQYIHIDGIIRKCRDICGVEISELNLTCIRTFSYSL